MVLILLCNYLFGDGQAEVVPDIFFTRIKTSIREFWLIFIVEQFVVNVAPLDCVRFAFAISKCLLFAKTFPRLRPLKVGFGAKQYARISFAMP